MKNKMRTKTVLRLLLLFILCFNFFYIIQANTPSIIGSDGFYHIKIADMMKEQGAIEEFPWMQHSILKDYADLMPLYHGLLIPFTFFDLEFGAKLSAVIFNSLMICAAYLLLRKFKIRYSFLWTLLLLGSSGFFLFRLSLPKVVPLSIIFSFIGLYLIIRRKHRSLFAASLLYAWLYTLAPILFFFSLINSAIIFARKRKIEWKLPLFSLLGIVLGFVINPYFPRNIYLWYVQTVKIALLPVESVFLGIEWYPYPLPLFAFLFMIPIAMFFLGTLLLAVSRKRKDSTILLFIISLVFLFLALKSKRYGEYFVPFAWLFFVLSLTSARYLYNKITKHKAFIPFTAAIIIILLAANLSQVVSKTRMAETTINMHQYEACADWLYDNTEEGTIVLSQWDTFAPLFFYNTKNYYVNGLDPTFLYFYDPGLYYQYLLVMTGKSSDISAFNASYVVASRGIPGFETEFSTDFCTVLKPRS
jgi:hypothetical protein